MGADFKKNNLAKSVTFVLVVIIRREEKVV